MDEGGGFFNVCLQVIDKNENHKAQKQRKSVKDFLSQSSSIKKFFIVSISEDISECYSNFSSIL